LELLLELLELRQVLLHRLLALLVLLLELLEPQLQEQEELLFYHKQLKR
jgi:hypothetical protein